MIRFVPIYKETIWGGNRFATEFDRKVTGDNIGESWELVDLDDKSSLAAAGPHEGRTLGELWRQGVLGGDGAGAFPFMLKWIDTRQKLSVQVHPDAEACKKLGKGAPKSEAWYVAEVDAEAVLQVGHYPGLDHATLKQAANGGTVGKWLYELRPRVGDMISVPAGTLHAIGAGLLLLEVSEPSDTTFRLFDWGRTDERGALREMHIEEACASVHFTSAQIPKAERERVSGPSFSMLPLHTGAEVPAVGLRVFVADSGPVKLSSLRGEERLDFGDVIVAEAADGPVRLVSGTAVLVAGS